MVKDIWLFAALMATAAALGGALAHAFELPNKIGFMSKHLVVLSVLTVLALCSRGRGLDWVFLANSPRLMG